MHIAGTLARFQCGKDSSETLCLLLYNDHVCYHISRGYFYCQRWATHYNFGTPGTIFEWITHTHSMLSVAIKLSLLVCNSSEKAELLIFCTEKYELKLDDMSYYVLYTFQTPMFTLFLPNCQVRVTFLCWNSMLGYFNNFILKICGWIIYPTKGLMFLPFMWGILHGFKLTL